MEQRVQARIVERTAPYGQGSQGHRLHESIVRGTAAGQSAAVAFTRSSLENSHAVHHRRHPLGRVVTGLPRGLHHWLVRPRAIGHRDRAVRRWAAERTTRTGIVIVVETGGSRLRPVPRRSIISLLRLMIIRAA